MTDIQQKDRLFLPEDRLQNLAQSIPTPFYLYDARGIRDAVERYRAAFAWNPGFRLFFPVKATPTAGILKLLGQAGCGMVCSSGVELELCAKCGFEAEQLLFLPNYPLPRDIQTAARLDAQIILDGAQGQRFAAAGCGMASVGLRYNPGGSFIAGGLVLSNPGEQKFGLDETALAEEVQRLKALGTRAVGLHAYLRGNTLHRDYMPTLARLLFTLAVKVHEEAGLPISYVNLSGGVGIPYEPGDQAADIAAVGQAVKAAYNEILIPAGLGNVPIWAEPGRYLTGPSGILVSRVVSVKRIFRNYAGLDASAADLMRPLLYGAYHHLTVLGKAPDAPRSPWDVVGGIAENTDKFAVQRLLPELEPGDLCVIHDAGAHGHAMGYNYGGKLRCAEYLLEDGNVRLLRRAETAEDFWRTQVFE